jgi:protein gp37
MSANSKIEWTDHTFNPWIGCTKVSPACDHCYAEVSTASRALGVVWGAGQPRRRTSPANWSLPLRWNAQAEAFQAQHGRRQRVFCASLADVFDNEVPDEWRTDLFRLIEATPNLDWLLLTKRIGNVRKMVGTPWLAAGGWPKHLRLGITICNQTEAERDVAKLIELYCPNFLSIEPLLSAINLRSLPYGEGEIDCLKPDLWETEIENWRDTSDDWEEDFEDWYGVPIADAVGPMHARIDWVIVGGESGTAARPMSPDWARSLRDQCAFTGVPFLFKQWGEWLPMLGQAEGVPVREKTTTPDGWVMGHAGKKAAGRLLDGVQHDGYPVTSQGTP